MVWGIWGHLEPFNPTSSAWPPSAPPQSIGDTNENTLHVITARLCLGQVSAFGTNTPLHCLLLTGLEWSRNLRSSPATALQPMDKAGGGSALYLCHMEVSGFHVSTSVHVPRVTSYDDWNQLAALATSCTMTCPFYCHTFPLGEGLCFWKARASFSLLLIKCSVISSIYYRDQML